MTNKYVRQSLGTAADFGEVTQHNSTDGSSHREEWRLALAGCTHSITGNTFGLAAGDMTWEGPFLSLSPWDVLSQSILQLLQFPKNETIIAQYESFFWSSSPQKENLSGK